VLKPLSTIRSWRPRNLKAKLQRVVGRSLYGVLGYDGDQHTVLWVFQLAFEPHAELMGGFPAFHLHPVAFEAYPDYGVIVVCDVVIL